MVAARFIRVCHDFSRPSRRATGKVSRFVTFNNDTSWRITIYLKFYYGLVRCSLSPKKYKTPTQAQKFHSSFFGQPCPHPLLPWSSCPPSAPSVFLLNTDQSPLQLLVAFLLPQRPNLCARKHTNTKSSSPWTFMFFS